MPPKTKYDSKKTGRGKGKVKVKVPDLPPPSEACQKRKVEVIQLVENENHPTFQNDNSTYYCVMSQRDNICDHQGVRVQETNQDPETKEIKRYLHFVCCGDNCIKDYKVKTIGFVSGTWNTQTSTGNFTRHINNYHGLVSKRTLTTIAKP